MKYCSFSSILFFLILIHTCASISATYNYSSREPYGFYEKITEIIEQIYKISAAQLQEILGCRYAYIPTICAQDLQEKMVHNQELLVINVLPKNLFDDCHIIGSQSVPLKELVGTVADWPRDREIVVYCALNICDAGQKAYVLLSCMGFTNVCDYEGGIKEWFQLGYPTAGPADCAYLHAKIAKLPDELEHEIAGCCGVELP